MKTTDLTNASQRHNNQIESVSQITTRFMLVLILCVGIFPFISCRGIPLEDLEVIKNLPTAPLINKDQNNGYSIEQSDDSFSQRDASLTETFKETASEQEIVKVTFIDVGQGDAILIRSPEGLFALIDGGDVSSNVVDFLLDQNVESLEIVVATHPHADHIGGLISVLNTFPTKRVITNGDMHTTVTFENFLDAIASSGSEYIEVVRGDEILFGTLTFFVLNPDHTLANDLDQNSIVMRLSYGMTTFLFTGDATKETEFSMMFDNCLLKADILQAAHHGSRTSTSPEFIREVRPEIAVYSAGFENIYGHPHPETITTLEEAGVVIYGTDVYGSITFIVDNGGYRIETEHRPQIIEFFD